MIVNRSDSSDKLVYKYKDKKFSWTLFFLKILARYFLPAKWVIRENQVFGITQLFAGKRIHIGGSAIEEQSSLSPRL